MTEAICVIASVLKLNVRVTKVLQPNYHLPDPFPWAALAEPLAAAEDAVARLDERLAKSPIREGWIARTHFSDACATLWLEGELVHLDDLVLHDARMDVRTPTHELTRAHAVLRLRRRVAAAEPDWALSSAGLRTLRGVRDTSDKEEGRGVEAAEVDELGDDVGSLPIDDDFDELFATVDAAIASADRALAGDTARRHDDRDPLVYDLDWDEDARLEEWRAVVERTRSVPPTLAAAIAATAWSRIMPLQHTPWLGRLLAAALLRARGKTRTHLCCLFEGLRAIPRERRHPHDEAGRLRIELEAMAATAEAGQKNHDRWLIARNLLARKLDGRRSTSRLPALLDFALSRPVVSAGMIAKELGITPRAAQSLVGELGLRETTGRRSYRAWGIQ
ncbi:RHE_PE00001 family protein [Rhizobium leguminosarum]